MLRRLSLATIVLACVADSVFPPGVAAPAPVEKPALVLKAANPRAREGKALLFVFEGTFPASVHRSGPEHFKLTRVSDGQEIGLNVAYDRETLDNDADHPREKVQRVRAARDRLRYNHLFKGVRLSLDSGRYDAKDTQRRADLLDLYGRAELEPGTRYRLTWACWPVGAREAAEISCDFETDKEK
jgi:hypothetical protein